MEEDGVSNPYFEGQVLVAMPGITDPRFDRTVIFLCSHSAEGAMGLVINRQFQGLDFHALLEQLDLDTDSAVNRPVYAGGPVETGRGFVLHSDDFRQESTLVMAGDVALTATIDILKALADGAGPKNSLIALGYAGWAPGQLDRELTRNGWLTANASHDLLFATPDEDKWPKALASIGIDPSMLSGDAGHA
jgi:putative transcriptional regulator